MPRVARGQRVDCAGDMGEGEVEAGARDQLEGGQLVGGGGAGVGEERHRVLDPRERQKRGLDLARLWEELQGRRGEDAERALAADEELLQIVAGVVLAQPSEPVPNPAVGQHHLDPQGQLAGIAVAQDRDAAGVGREVAADLAAALGAEAERKKAVGRGGGFVQVGEDAAGLDRHREVDRVDRADAVHPAQCQDDVVALARRDAAADEPGVAALRHDREPRGGADPHHRRHLLRRGRAHDQPGRAAIEAARLDQIRLLLARVGDPAPGADDLLDPVDCRVAIHNASHAPAAKCGVTSAAKRAISSLTWGCGFNPTLK